MKLQWPLCAILLVSLAWYLACANCLQVGQSVDDASYVTLARALASGQGYRMVCYPEAPEEGKYPPLLPLLMAPCLALTHGALWATRLPALLCMLGAIPVLAALLRRVVSDPARWWLLALVALHPMLVGFAGMPMTEAPSVLLTWGALLLVLQGAERNDHRRFVAAGVVIGLALLLRTDAVALLVAVSLWLAATRRWRALACTAVPAVVLFAPWVWHALAVGQATPGQPGYLQEIATGWWDRSPLPLRMWHALGAYVGGYIPEQVGLIFGDVVEQAAAARGLGLIVKIAEMAVGAVVVYGFVRSRRAVPSLLGLFVLVRLGLLLVFAPVSRYLLPLLPFLLVYAAEGLRGLSPARWRREEQGASPAPQRPLWALCVLLLLPALARDGLLIARPPRDKYPDAIAGGQLIAAHTPPGAVVLSNWCGKAFALYAPGRLAVEPLQGTEQAAPDELLAAAPQGALATHLLMAGPPSAPAPRALSPRLRLVAQDSAARLWLFAIQR